MRWSWVGLLAVVLACAEAPQPVLKRWPLDEVAVRVRVVDAANQPVPGVSLVARRADRGSTVARGGTTDANGTALLRVMPGWYVLQAEAPGFVSVIRTDARVPFGEEVRWDVTLVRAAPFAGRVVDLEGRPVAGALLRLRLANEAAVAIPPAESDAEGRFHFDSVPAGTVKLRAEKDGWSPTRLELAAPAPEVTVVMGGLSSLRVRVLDPQGRVLSGKAGDIYAMDERQSSELFPERGPEDVVFQPLRAGRYLVTGRYWPSPECWWERSIEVQVAPGSRTEATVSFEGIHGLGPWRARAVESTGKGIADQDGMLWAGSTSSFEPGLRGKCDFRTAGDGSFLLSHLVEAPDSISMTTPNWRFNWSAQGSPSPGTGEALVFRKDGGALKGRVVRPDDQPVGSFEVDGFPPHQQPGEYVQYVPMTHTYQWVISVLGFAPALVRAQGREGEVLQVPDVVLEEGRTVRGRVFARNGRTGVPHQEVQLVETFDLDGHGPRRRLRAAMTDAEGRFDFEHVPGRLQYLRVDAKGQGTVLQALEPDASAVRLRLVPNAELQGAVTDGARVPLAGVRMEVRCEGGFKVSTGTDGAGNYAMHIPGDRECFLHPVVGPLNVRGMHQPPPVAFAPRRLRLAPGSRHVLDPEPRQDSASLRVEVEASLEFVTAFLLPGDVPWPRSSEALDALMRAGSGPDSRPGTWESEDGHESFIPTFMVRAAFRFSHLPRGHYTLFIRDQMEGADAILRIPVELTGAGEHVIRSARPSFGGGRPYTR
ncbi:carboxypeptidase-like regulatory domain-containing protein [Corallococcus interemptor]|uniref:carboxypeptidase-like regulatory domain-containing protein n=1 Tax=Corallococcus interemptor TaxID=2316720 RepID=UPI0035D428C1